MSDTYNSQLGRESRELNRQLRDASNHGQGYILKSLNDERSSMPVGNMRYGNKRKYMAKEKIRNRRSDRRNFKKLTFVDF